VISICSLIYKSRKYAKAVWESAHEFTPHLKDGRARFFFVANDPVIEIDYPHVVQRNEVLSEAKLIALGFRPPEYIRRVYQGWNRAIQESEEQMVLVNSDNLFSPGWLDGLLQHYSENTVVCSKLIERYHPKHGRFVASLPGDFGDNPDSFDKPAFLEYAIRSKFNKTEEGGAFMPLLMSRAKALEAGGYPEGNRTNGAAGDKAFFSSLAKLGVRHITALDSLVYHFKEGEMDE